jgi:hypothetical protein
MKKLGLLTLGVAAATCAIVGAAFAANSYTVNTASVSPTKAGTSSKPKSETISFGFSVASSDGNRPTVTTDYIIAFGKKIVANRKYFKGSKTCTIGQAGYSNGASPSCPSGSKAGSGSINSIAGLTLDPTSKIPCYLALTLFVGDGKSVPPSANDGIPVKNDIVLGLKAGPNSNPAKNCALSVDGSLPAAFTKTAKGTALKFHVKKIPFQQPQPGIDNAVVSVSSKVGKTVKVKGKTRGLLESIGCTGSAHPVNVLFTDASKAVKSASKNAPCRK